MLIILVDDESTAVGYATPGALENVPKEKLYWNVKVEAAAW